MTNQEYSNRYAKQHKRYERRAYPIFLKALRLQLAPTIEWIRLNGNIDPPLDALVVPSVWRKPMVEVYEIIGMTSAKREYFFMRSTEEKGALDFLIERWRMIFYEYSINYAYRIENELSETTKEEIRRALRYSYLNGLNGDQTADYITKQVGGAISRNRAVLISRTETTTASNLGKQVGARQWLGDDVGYKQWIGREDERERHTHLELNDKIIPADEDWDVGGQAATAPGDARLSGANRINCRCTQIFMSTRRYNRMISEQQG